MLYGNVATILLKVYYDNDECRVFCFHCVSGVGLSYPPHLINFWVTFLRFSPISGNFGYELLGRCSSYFAVAKTGKERCLCSSRLGKRFIQKSS